MAAELKAKISLDTSAFTRGLNTARAQLASVGASIAKIGSIAGVAAAGIGAIGAISLARGVKEALDFGSSLTELSARTGAPIKDLVLLQQVFKDAGIGSEAVGANLNRMQKALVGINEDGEPTNKMFSQLGLNTKELLKLSPSQQFESISKSIGALANPAERSAAAMAIFGKSGGELISVFKDPAAFGNAAKAVGSQADILQRNAEAFDRVSDVFNSIGVKFRGFFVGVAESLLPALQKAADFLATIDLAPMGQALGNAISSAINVLTEAFKQGKMGELIGLSFKTGFATAGDFLIEAIHAALDILGSSIARIFSADFFEGLIVGFAALGKKIGAFLIEAFQTPLTYLSAGMAFIFQELAKKMIGIFNPVLGKIGEKLIEASGITFSADELLEGAKSFFNSDTAKSMSKEGDKLFQHSGKLLKPVGDDIADIIKKRLGNFTPSDLFGSAELQTKLVDLASSLNVPLETVKQTAQALANSQATQALSSPQKAAAPDSDRLLRIGGFVGGGASSAINFARMTANNTTQMVKGIEKLIELTIPSNENMAAVWGDGMAA